MYIEKQLIFHFGVFSVFHFHADMMDGACTTHLLLETIMEETSDDLRSETSGSEYNSGLLTDSMSTVIHVPSYEKNLHTRSKCAKNWVKGGHLKCLRFWFFGELKMG